MQNHLTRAVWAALVCVTLFTVARTWIKPSVPARSPSSQAAPEPPTPVSPANSQVQSPTAPTGDAPLPQASTSPPQHPPKPFRPPPNPKPVGKADYAKAQAFLKHLNASDFTKEAARRNLIMTQAFTSEQTARAALTELEACVKLDISSLQRKSEHSADFNTFVAQALVTAKADCARMAKGLAGKFQSLQKDVEDRILKFAPPSN